MKPPAWLPVVALELRRTARRAATWRWRFGVAAAALVTLWAIARTLELRFRPAAELGPALFTALSWVAALYCLVFGATAGADSLSAERREGTLPLLFLTGLRARHILAGKFAATSLNVLYGLLGLLPLLVLPLMLGGVDGGRVLAVGAALVNLLFCLIAASLVVSALATSERQAVTSAVLAGIAWTIGLPLGQLALAEFLGERGFLLALGLLSPLAPLGNVLAGARWPVTPEFLAGLGVTHLLGWALLGLAGGLLRRAASGRAASAAVRPSLDQQLFTPANPRERHAFRRALLDLHPLVWLAERHPGAARYGAIFVGAVVVILAFGAARYGASSFSGLAFLPIVFSIHLTLLAWSTTLGCQRAVEDRRSGALELWLSTPLTDAELLRGHWLVLRRLFLRPIGVLVAGQVALGWLFFEEWWLQQLILAAALVLPLDMAAASLLALRFGLTAPSVNQAAGRVFLLVPGAGLLAGALLQGAATALLGAGFFPWFWAAGCAAVDLLAIVLVRRGLLGRLRETVALAGGAAARP